MSLQDILSTVKPHVRRVTLMHDGDLADRIKSTRKQLREAETNQQALASNEVEALREVLDELEAEADSKTVEYVFHTVPKENLESLKLEYPPTEEVWERYKLRLAINPLAAPPEFDPGPMTAALIAESLQTPILTPAEVETLLGAISDGDAATLADAAWSVSMQGSDRPLSKTAIGGT